MFHLNVSERGRFFQGAEEFKFCLVTDGTDLELNQDLPLFVRRLDTHQTHAGRHDLLQIHKHLRPIETLLVYQRVEECGALVQPGVSLLLKKSLQLVALAHKPDHLLAHGRGFCAQGGVALTHGIYMPSERETDNAGYHTNETGHREKLAVQLQWICRYV